jgi:hypothetical protein
MEVIDAEDGEAEGVPFSVVAEVSDGLHGGIESRGSAGDGGFHGARDVYEEKDVVEDAVIVGRGGFPWAGEEENRAGEEESGD